MESREAGTIRVIRALVFGGLIVVFLCPAQLPAQTITGTEDDWKSSTTTLWGTATNWSLGTVPGLANTAAFTSTSAASGTITLSGSSVVGIVWKAGAPAYTLTDTSGSQITLTLGADGLQNYSSNAQTITGSRVGIALGSSTSFDVGGTGDLTISAGGTTPLSLGSNTLTLKGSSTGLGTISSVISGTGSIVKAGSGIWTLSAVNTYSGTTTVNAGTLKLGVTSALPNTAVTVSGTGAGTTATLDLNNFSNSIASLTLGGSTTTSGASVTTGLGTLTLGGGVTYDATNNPLGATITGNVALGLATRTFNIGDSTSAVNDLTVSAVISGTGGLTKTGTGTLLLSGANTYSGGTNINAGIISLGSSGALGSSGTISFGGGTLQYTASNTTDYSGRFSTAAGQTYNIDTNGQSVTFATALTSSGGSLTKNGTGTLTLGGTDTYSGGTTVNAGTLQLSVVNQLLSTGAITIAGGTLTLQSFNQTVGSVTLASGTISGTGILTGSSYALQSGTISAVMAGAGNATKSTSGTVTLSGVNTYTGTTTVNAGTLSVTGSLASGSAVTVNNSGTVLEGTGTIFGTVSVASSGAILEAGTGSTGQTLTMRGAVTMASGSIISLALGASGAHSTVAIGAGGSISFQSLQKFNIIDLGVATGSTYSGLITGIGADPNTESGWSIANQYWAYNFSYDSANGGEIDLSVTALPEPSTYVAGALALLAIAYHQRTRLRRIIATS